ncbi:MAG: nucleotidyltransferase family protein [Oscillospiraceae bacterium]|nr:nucleotidyltransferase family protein [Oscillospiraceae bacterium]
MNICGIVCEYNPFHNGHMHHIQKAKEAGADAIICIMSGNFVQRGDFAIMRKHARAEAAVRSGADIVIELPLPWSLASAEKFAHGAISILHMLGVCSSVSFGAECDDISALKALAKILADNSLDSAIMSEYSSGISFAAAREAAVAKHFPELSKLLKTPNNILATEYIKALLRLESKIVPVAVMRKGTSHDSDNVFDGFASASLIREKIAHGDDFSALLPPASHEIYLRELDYGNAPVLTQDADSSVMSVLKRFSPEDFRKYSDISEGLEFRLCDCIAQSTTLKDTADLAKTKRYAHSRIRRILLNAFLGCEAHFSEGIVPYARILAFNRTGREIIKKAKKRSDVPVITRPSEIKNESKKAESLLALESRADDIYSLFMKKPFSQGSTYTISPVYVDI